MPAKLFDRNSGEINPEVAQFWKSHDIQLFLKKNWSKIKTHLKGKIHIIAAGDDNWYLEESVELLKSTLEDLKSDAQVEIIPATDHFTLLPKINARLILEIDQYLIRKYPNLE